MSVARRLVVFGAVVLVVIGVIVAALPIRASVSGFTVECGWSIKARGQSVGGDNAPGTDSADIEEFLVNECRTKGQDRLVLAGAVTGSALVIGAVAFVLLGAGRTRPPTA